jgi:hypothetical protein
MSKHFDANTKNRVTILMDSVINVRIYLDKELCLMIPIERDIIKYSPNGTTNELRIQLEQFRKNIKSEYQESYIKAIMGVSWNDAK